MSASPDATLPSEDAAAAVASILARTGLPVSDEERERLTRFYLIVRGWAARLQMVEASNADPATIFSALPHD